MHEAQHNTAAPAPSWQPSSDRMVDLSSVLRGRDLNAPSVIYREIGEGLFIEPIKLSARCSRWLESEVTTLDGARIAGLSEDEIRQVVIQLRTKRKARGALLMAAA